MSSLLGCLVHGLYPKLLTLSKSITAAVLFAFDVLLMSRIGLYRLAEFVSPHVSASDEKVILEMLGLAGMVIFFFGSIAGQLAFTYEGTLSVRYVVRQRTIDGTACFRPLFDVDNDVSTGFCAGFSPAS